MGFPVKTPKYIKRLFPKYVWEKAFSNPTIYLTFDDGPTPEITEWTLTTLQQYNAKATFFCIGDNIKKHPEILKKIADQGHTIGNHTFNHLNGWKTSTNTYIKNANQAQHKIELELGNSPFTSKKLFRPPYGRIKNSQAKQLINKGYQIIMWSVIAYDWKQNLTKEQCLANVIKHSKNGSIVVFHDSVKASKNMKYTLPKMLAHFTDKGFKFEAL